jgi:flagellar hook-associated protein 3 FlgL
MTITNVSFLGQTVSQNNNLSSLNSQIATLEQQISSGQQNQTLAGFGGVTAQNVVNTRIDSSNIDAYLSNITTVNNNINQMNQALTSAQSSVQQVINGIASAIQQSPANVPSLIGLAKNTLGFVEDLANLNVNGRYMFAGSDTTAQPVTGDATLNSNMQSEVTGWLNGSISTAQFQADVAGLSNTQVGLNPALSTSGSVTAQIDHNTNIDYTVNAGTSGFQNVIKALGLLANLKVPNPATDTPTTAELEQMLTQVSQLAQSGVNQLAQAQGQLGNTAALIHSVQGDQQQDQATLKSYLSSTENTDTTKAVTQLQALQTQLQASYDVTSTLSKLSLVNFL